MSWKLLLSACVAAGLLNPEAGAQTAPQPPSQPTVPALNATPPPVAAPIVSVNSEPEPLVITPTNQPAETATSPALSGTCDTLCQNFWTRSTMTGDWGGLRPRMQENGITFEGNITQFGFGLGGGINSPRIPPILGQGNTGAYTGRGDYKLTFDLEKFGGLPYGKLVVGAQHWYGQYGNVSLNTGAFPPAVFPAALPPRPNNQGIPYLTDFFLLQPLSKEWVVFAGKKNVIGAADQDDFAGGNGTEQFMNQAFIANPAFLLGLPYSSITAGVASPREWGSFSAFVYDPQDRTQNAFDRLDTLFSQGVIVGAEAKLKTNFFNLPGEQHVGGIWKHVELTDLRFNEPPPGVYPYPPVPGFATLNDSYTLYYGMDQYFQVYDQSSKRGWGMFARASISDGNPTPIRYFLSAGLGGYSPFRHRQGDKFGVGFYYTGMSKEFGPIPQALFGPRDGYGVELFYNVQVTPWMSLTPDFQIVKPEAGRIAEMAYIGGLRLNLKF
jgi:porin